MFNDVVQLLLVVNVANVAVVMVVVVEMLIATVVVTKTNSIRKSTGVFLLPSDGG